MLGQYRAHLSAALSLSFKAMPGLAPVVGPMGSTLEGLSKRYIGVRYSILSLHNLLAKIGRLFQIRQYILGYPSTN